MLEYLRHLLRLDRRVSRGASSVEYGLLITAIAAVIAVIVFTFGDNVLDLFSETCDALSDSRGSGECETTK